MFVIFKIDSYPYYITIEMSSEYRKSRAINFALSDLSHKLHQQLYEYKRKDPMQIRNGVYDDRTHAVIHIVSMNAANEQGGHVIAYDDIESLDIHDLDAVFPGIANNLKRGDLISNSDDSGYRAQGVSIFDGETANELSSVYDDYVHIPEDYCIITEFPPGYWDPKGFDEHHTICYYTNSTGNPVESDFYWHCDPEMELINIKILGIEDAYKKAFEYLTNSGKSKDSRNSDVNLIECTYGDKTHRYPYIDFTWDGKRYFLMIDEGYHVENSILIVFRFENLEALNFDAITSSPEKYAYIMRTSM